MQRSFPYQNALNQLLFVALFAVYISLSSLYLLFPPLLAILFFAFTRALQKHDLFSLIVVIAMLLIFEAEKGFWFGSTVLFFTFVANYVIPKIEQIVQCRVCLAAIYTALAYPGYWVFMWTVNQVLLLSIPAVDWHLFLYAVIEFLVLAVFI